MLLSIIIPAWNEEKLLPATLSAVSSAAAALAAAGIAHEIIVCDNNSTDRTAEIAAAAGLKVVFEPVNQISRARNTGAAAAAGEWLLFVDADSEPSTGLLADLAETLRDDRCIGGGSVLHMDVKQFAARCALKGWETLSRTFGWAAGSFLFCRTDAFIAVGGFSTELFASEEIDLSKKLKKEGARSGRKMRILTKHPLRSSARKLSLYSVRDHARFIFRTLLSGGRTLKRRDACEIWYEGKR